MNTLVGFYTRIAAAISLIYLAILFCLSSEASAQIPRTISYQGTIVSPNGIPITDGMHVLKISLYDDITGGTSLYSESIAAQIRSGFFSVAIGETTPLPASLIFDRSYFLAVAVDGGEEMNPRTAFTSVPYALHSQIADYANGLSPDIKGVVTSINEIGGPLHLVGDSTVSVTSSGKSIRLHAVVGNAKAGILSIADTDNTMIISNPNGP